MAALAKTCILLLTLLLAEPCWAVVLPRNATVLGTSTTSYDAMQGVRISCDPIGENGGLNLYGYVANDPINAIDPLGLLVEVVLYTKLGMVAVTDLDTNQVVYASANTGGFYSKNNIFTPNPFPAPKGNYTIVDEPSGAHGPPERWYGLFKNDIWTDDATGVYPRRTGIRFHLGSTSLGCATVSRYQRNAAEKWRKIDEMLQRTTKGAPVQFKDKVLTNYGTFRIE